MTQSVRSLAAEAGITVDECVLRLSGNGLGQVVGARRLDGQALAGARATLGLGRHAGAKAAMTAPAARTLDGTRMILRLLRPLREKGKTGRNHTTSLEHLYGHGIPDHQKDAAKRMVDLLLGEGCLDEKVSQGRRHFWLTTAGLARLSRAEEEAGAAGGPGPAARG